MYTLRPAVCMGSAMHSISPSKCKLVSVGSKPTAPSLAAAVEQKYHCSKDTDGQFEARGKRVGLQRTSLIGSGAMLLGIMMHPGPRS